MRTCPEHRRDGYTVEHQSGRIFDQAFAFQDRDNAMRNAQTPGNGGRRHGVRRRDNRAQHNGRGPAQPRKQRMGQHRHHRCRRQHQANREHHDRAEIRPEFAQRGKVRRSPEDRGKKHEKHHIRAQANGRQTRDQSQNKAADDEEYGIGDEESAGQGRQAQHHTEQEDDSLQLCQA